MVGFEVTPEVHGSGNLFEIYSDGSNSFEALLSAIPAVKSDPAKTTELVLHDNGSGEYTLDQMWIQGDKAGYEFLGPKSDSREKQLTSVEVRAESTR